MILKESSVLKINLKNKYTYQIDSLSYFIEAIKDEYPVIQVKKRKIVYRKVCVTLKEWFQMIMV